MLTRTAHAQGSWKQGGASFGSGSKDEWRSFNNKFLGLVRLNSATMETELPPTYLCMKHCIKGLASG